LPEQRRKELDGARLVACPGCYPTAAVLGLKPLVCGGLLEPGIIIDAKSGISGAGKTPTERTHYSECHDSISAYGVFAHRHAAEIEQELGVSVTFVPHLVPLDRGIFETIYARLRPGVDAAAVESALVGAYASSPFVRLTRGDLPEIKHVAHTNFCDIGWRVDAPGGQLVMAVCIDNLVKGAAGQAIQNFNVMFGFDETTTLF
jgi:N-acetyl-gamma-glutamyl-phosphate reductase